MDILLWASSSLWLGILTSISPCPLTTNIVAISYVGYRVTQRWKVLFSGLLYAAGRSIAYAVLGLLIIKALVSIPILSNFLQQYINKILGFVLILAGLYLLEIIPVKLPNLSISDTMQNRFYRAGMLGSFILGIAFALAFCPISAALFFGSLIPLALKSQFHVTLCVLYGIGTALPTLIFVFLIAVGSNSINQVYQRLTRIEYYAKKITGTVFILAGIYYILAYLLGVL
jgi:cytochrome c-type biogenesis protein